MSEALQQALSILVVEDDAGDFGLIRAYMRLAGLGGSDKELLIWAKTLAEGLSEASRNKFDIVLLDLSLPDSSGISTVLAMREALPEAPLVVLTGQDDNEFADAALQAGAQDYLVKGQFENDALKRAVRHAILRNKLELERNLANEFLRKLSLAVEQSFSSIVITNLEANIEYVNKAFVELTSYSFEEAVGQNPRILKSGKTPQATYDDLWACLTRGDMWKGEFINQAKDGREFTELALISPVRQPDGRITHYIAVKDDITERKQAEEQIRNLAFYDTLTQLPNRRLLNDRLRQAMASSKRSKRYGAVMFLDLDNFKPLNDIHGHGAGDLLLTEVARRLTLCVREVDTVARFGGDEFVVMLSELDEDKAKSVAEAAIVAEKIRSALDEPYLLKLQPQDKTENIAIEHHCTVSIGVALFIGHEASAEVVIKWADIAMYQAKEGGRNSVHFWEEPVVKL